MIVSLLESNGRDVFMLDRDLADAALQRVSLLSFLYYPEIQVDEPSYSLSSDVDFCMESLVELGEQQRDELRQLIGRAIIDPSEYREEVFVMLTEMVTPATATQ